MHDVTRLSTEPVQRRYRTVADFAYSRIRERIIRGDLAPGERIDQDAEAKRFDVSRMPVREALRRLATEGLVDLQPHRGAVVTSLSADDLADIYLLRIELEALAARLGVPRMTDEDIAHMRALLPRMEEIVASELPEPWPEIDWQFHSAIYAAAGQPRLLRFIWALWDEGSRYRLVRLALPNELRVSLDVHYRILEACERRDAEAVEKLIADVLIESRDKLLREIRLSGDDAVRAIRRSGGDGDPE